jgi:rhodanese-related sulfurtransferase
VRVPWWFPFGQVSEIAPRELLAELGNGAGIQLLDVREPVEFRQGHIEGARNVPIRDLPRKLETLGLDSSRPVVAICLSGHRSIPAYRLLKRSGYSQVYSLSGGMIAWWSDHLPIAKDGQG